MAELLRSVLEEDLDPLPFDRDHDPLAELGVHEELPLREPRRHGVGEKRIVPLAFEVLGPGLLGFLRLREVRRLLLAGCVPEPPDFAFVRFIDMSTAALPHPRPEGGFHSPFGAGWGAQVAEPGHAFRYSQGAIRLFSRARLRSHSDERPHRPEGPPRRPRPRDRGAQLPLLRDGRPERHRRRLRRAHARDPCARGSASGARDPALADPARLGRAARRGNEGEARRPDVLARQRLLGRRAARVPPAGERRAPERRDAHVLRRAEARRRERGGRLRGGAPRDGEHAGGRRDGRRRDPERADDPRGAAFDSAPREDHAAGRGPHLPEGPRQVQRRARSGRPRALRKPAQRGGRRGADARRARGGEASAARALLPARRGAKAPREPFGVARAG